MNDTNNNIKVSLIIPVYQVENYLERAVDSALAQTLCEKEIILVDDGSFDNSPQICDFYAEKYPDIIRVIHTENNGLGMARNRGAAAAKGEFIAFMDSDDTIEPDMLLKMYEKAVKDDCDIVMCDVNIIYVQENRNSVVECYKSERIDIADYIANGNNITYSVNKLYRRRIWEENRYEKMLFEDIALIPSLITKYPKIGYVKEPFYNYYRRPNTISTTMTGDMVDIIRAFDSFLDTSSQKHHSQAVYITAKQVLWNMTSSRTLFKADFIDFLNRRKSDFLLNEYIKNDPKTSKILEFIDTPIIPDNIICVHFDEKSRERIRHDIAENFPLSRVIDIDENSLDTENAPECVKKAVLENRIEFALEYFALKSLFENGGIIISDRLTPKLQIKTLRLEKIFFGFEDNEALNTDCFGAVKEHYIIQSLLNSYERENICNKAFLPLKERLRDFLIINFNLIPNGRKQFLKNEVRIFLPSVLSYDMHDGENCCKYCDFPIPEGYELVKDNVLKMWSERIMENWNLYKSQLNAKGKKIDVQSDAPHAVSSGMQPWEVDAKIAEVVSTYENSTSWKLTKPIRILGDIFGRGKNFKK